MSGSNALTIPRDPTVLVNPLAAMNEGATAAGNVMKVQAAQGERLVGQALQQATDENGNLDVAKAQRIASQMGPNAAFAMQGFLKTGSELRGNQIKQNLTINDAVNGAVTAALASDDANLKQAVIEQAGRLRGILPADQVDHALLHLSSDPAQLRAQLETLRVQSLPPQQRQDWIYGTRQPTQFGGGTAFPTVPAAGRGDAPIVLQTLTPDQLNQNVTIPDPRRTLPNGQPNPEYMSPKSFTRQEQLEMNGFVVLPNGQVIPPGGGGTGGGGTGGRVLGDGRYPTAPPAIRNPNASPPPNPPAPNAPAAPGTIQFGNPDQPQAVPAPPGGATSTAPYTGGGIGSVLAPAAPGPRSDVMPPPNANVAAIMRGMQNADVAPLAGGAMTAGPGAPTAPTVAATPEPGWGVAPGTYGTTPTAPVARPAAAPPPAQRSPFDRPPMGASPGQLEKVKADVETFTQDQKTYPDLQTRAQNLAHAYDALNMLKSATGRGAEGINNLRSYMQTLGILPAGAVDEQRLFEIIHKYTERAMIDAAGGGSTDMGKRMQEQANAGTLLSSSANAEIMRNDLGKALQAAAAYKDFMAKDPQTDGAGYNARRAEVADTTDPRGFVWNLYSPSEQAKILAEVKGSAAAEGKLHRAIGMVKVLNLQIPGLTPPTRQGQSFLAPSAPPANPLAMTRLNA